MKKILFCVALAACKPGAEKAPTADKPATEPKSENGPLTLAEATAGLPAEGKLYADITTPQGKISCELYPEAAPETVASFVGLARGLRAWKDPESRSWVKRPFYNGLAFHRVIPRFMIQGGDPLSRDYDHPGIGSGGPGFTLPDELAADLRFDRPGRLAVANTGPRTHSGGSQFFITEVPYPSLDGGYVIFGQCDAPDVVQAITRLPATADKPEQPVTMKVEISRR
jgi:peptidyl-prolyl cis-trans isomerase A (cyclophilin A)